MNIPGYPAFRPLEREDQSVFDEAFRNNPPEISEFTFTNLYSWRRAYRFTVSLLDDFLILCSELNKGKAFFPPIGAGNVKPVIERVLHETSAVFIRLPEQIQALFKDDDRFEAKLDRDFCDYVYSTGDLIQLAGRKYDGKRNLIKNFKSNHSHEYIKLEAANAGLVLRFEETWCTIKNCDSIEGLSEERRAIKDMVSNFKEFNLVGGAVKINGEIRAVTLAQALNRDTMVLHVLKADPNLTGLYQVMNQEFLSHEAGHFPFVNFEQDVGSAGLRKFKESYHPLRMINKYTLHERKG